MLPTPDPTAHVAAELRHRTLVVAAVTEQVDTVMSLVAATANDPRWRGSAARMFAEAIERRLGGLIVARRSLDMTGDALAWAAREAERRASEAAAAARLIAGGHG